MRVRWGVPWVAVPAAVVFAWTLTASAGAAGDAVDCGSAITEDTVLTHDLLDCEDGVTVAPGVTLDLGGHEIAGVGAGTGVRLQAPGAVVRDGSIRAFRIGVSGGTGIRIEDTTIQRNGTGISLSFATGIVIVGNRILSNEGHGVSTMRADNSLVGNLVMHNGGHGALLDETNALVTDNTFSRNGGDGLVLNEGSGCNFLNFSRIGSNVADGNQGLGINVIPHCGPEEPFDLLDAGGNSAKQNGDPRECTIHVECARNRGQADKLTR